MRTTTFSVLAVLFIFSLEVVVHRTFVSAQGKLRL